MKKWMHRIELIIDHLIPSCLLLLLGIIISEIFYEEAIEHYVLLFEIAEGVIISIFVADLIFKYLRAKTIPDFLKKSWLDIIAVFPFFLVIRLLESSGLLFRFGESIAEFQPVLHEGVGVEKEASKLVKEAEGMGKISRTRIFARFLRPIARLPRLVKAFTYFERPTGNHHAHDSHKIRRSG